MSNGNLLNFQISEEEDRKIKKYFTLLSDSISLQYKNKENDLLIVKNKIGNGNNAGIYFFVLIMDSIKYKVYIGKTKNIIYRVKNYYTKFQVHSPNDNKLHIFQKFIHDSFPSGNILFNLYFMTCDPEKLSELENSYINTFKPIININLQPECLRREIDELEKAFNSYFYRDFNIKLNGAPAQNVTPHSGKEDLIPNKDLKDQLADTFLNENQDARRLFIDHARQFKQWANYIAGFVLNQRNEQITAKNIKKILHDEIIPNHYNREGFSERSLLTGDLEIEANDELAFRCFKRIGYGKYKLLESEVIRNLIE